MVIADQDFNKLFEDLDKGKTGMITYTEYLAGAVELSSLQNETMLKEAFNFFDRDGSGTISKDEVRISMKKGWISESQLSELFKEIDTNKDEKVLLSCYIHNRYRLMSSRK